MLKLSIILLTYNHEDYIAQALDSILMQKVDFDYELIMLEDCSTDKTREVILKNKNKLQNVKFLFNEKNYGAKFTHSMGKQYARGEYVVLLEGDDYWTDSNKLQQQIDFLDENPDFVGCSHNTELYYEKENKRENMLQSGKVKSVHNIVDLVNGTSYFHTSSYVWRNIFKNGFPKEAYYSKILMGDWFLSMLYAKHGKIKYIDKVMSCYRITGKGVWSKLSSHQQQFNNIRGMYVYNKLLGYAYSKEFERIWYACDGLLKVMKKDKASALFILKCWLLKKSIDVSRNQYFQKGTELIKSFLDRRVNYRITTFSLYRLFFKVILSLSKIVDRVIMKFFEFLFNCFFLFDANRYYLYYKVNFYKIFKINIYKKGKE